MENTWTIFHRSGRYTADYKPIWQRYGCYGGDAQVVVGADADGSRQDRVQLRLTAHSVRIVDEAGQVVCLTETGIGPGDLLVPGAVTEPGVVSYRIQRVTVLSGLGLLCGWQITAA